MAEQTTKERKEQQGIETQINALLKERLDLMKQIERQLSKQSAFVKDLNDAISEGSDSFNEASKSANELTKSTKKVSDQAAMTADVIKAGMDESAGASNKLGSALKLAGGGFSILAGAATAGMSLVTGALSSAWGIAKAVVGTVMSIGKAFFNVAKAIITLPFDLLNNLMEIGNELRGIGLDIARAWEDVREVFGDLSTTVGADIRSTVINLGMIGDTGLDAYQVLGTMSQRIESVSKVFQGLGGAVMLFSEEIKNSNGAVIAFQRGLGFTEEQLQGVATVAMLSGKSLVEVQTEIANQAIQLGETFGIPKKLIGKDVAEMVNDIDTFGNMTVKQMAKTSVYAKKLGVDVKKMAGVFKAFNNFEDAAVGAAKLSQAFGMNIDVVKQLKAGSPAEVIEDLRQAFFAAGKDAANLNRHELALLAAQTGLDQETAKRVFSLENQGVAYEDIANKADEAESAQLTAANAMKQVAKDIKRIVHEVLKVDGVFKEFRKGMEKGITMDDRFMRLVDIATDLGISMRGLGQYFGKALMQIEPVKQIFDGLGDTLEMFSGLLKNVAKEFIAWANDLGKGGKKAEQAGADLVDRLGKVFDDFMNNDKVAGGLEKIKNGLLSLGTIILNSLSGIIPRAMEKLTSLLETGVQWMNSPSSITGKLGLGKSSSAFLGAFVNLFNKIKDRAGPLWAAVKDFISTALSKGAEGIENSPFVQKLTFMFKKLGKTMMAEMMQGIGEALMGNWATKGIGESLLQGAKIQRNDIDWMETKQSQIEVSREKGRQEEVKHRQMMNKFLDQSGLKGEKLEAAKKKARGASALVGQQSMLKEQIAQAKQGLGAALKTSPGMHGLMTLSETMKDFKAKKAALGEYGKLNFEQKKIWNKYAMGIQESTLKINKLRRDDPLAAERLEDEQKRIATLQTKLKNVTAKLQPYLSYEGFEKGPKTPAALPDGFASWDPTKAAKKADKDLQKTKAHAKSFQTQAENFKAVNEGVTKSINNSNKEAKKLVTTVKPVLTKDGTIADQKTLTIKTPKEIINLALNVSMDAKQVGNGLLGVELEDGKKFATSK
jgi:hypothetical protein